MCFYLPSPPFFMNQKSLNFVPLTSLYDSGFTFWPKIQSACITLEYPISQNIVLNL